MEANLHIIQSIMIKAIKITTTQKQDVSFEFYPMTSVLVVSICFNGKSSNGLTKTWGVNIRDTECLGEVMKDLNDIDETLEGDFLGGDD